MTWQLGKTSNVNPKQMLPWPPSLFCDCFVSSGGIMMDLKTVEEKSLKKRRLATIEFKKELINKFEGGARVRDLSLEYHMPRSTISSILKRRQIIKAASVAKGVKNITRQRPQILEEVEKLLLIWLNRKRFDGDSITEPIVCEKAKQLYADLLSNEPETSANESGKTFKASHGWYEKFKKRSGMFGQEEGTACVNKKSTEKFVRDFKECLSAEGFIPQQVFTCNETGLFWKKLPNKTFLAKEEMALPGHRPMNDRVTLLLCCNVTADLKLKPLLVYHSENPRAFHKQRVTKSELPVLWRSHPKEWITRQLFIEWMNEVFGPTVKIYLTDNNLPLKVLFLLDNFPAYPLDLEDSLHDEFNFISVRFLPLDATHLLRPMDQQVFDCFKKLYVKALLEKCLDFTFNTELNLRQFWKNHFDIVHSIQFVHKAWGEVPPVRIQSGWKKLWPEIGTVTDSETLDMLSIKLMEDILTLSETLNLEINRSDLEELLFDQRKELSTEELRELKREQEKVISVEMSTGVEETKEEISTSEIRDIFAKWEEVQRFVEEHHPNKSATSMHLTIMNDQVFAYFRGILKKRQKSRP